MLVLPGSHKDRCARSQRRRPLLSARSIRSARRSITRRASRASAGPERSRSITRSPCTARRANTSNAAAALPALRIHGRRRVAAHGREDLDEFDSRMICGEKTYTPAHGGGAGAAAAAGGGEPRFDLREPDDAEAALLRRVEQPISRSWRLMLSPPSPISELGFHVRAELLGRARHRVRALFGETLRSCGVAMMRRTSVLRRVTNSCGVPARTKRPYHCTTS